MRSRRLLVGILLVFALVLLISVPAFAATSFTDTGSSSYSAAITNLSNWGIVSGYSDGTFRPDNLVQRQQFAKMMVLGMGYAVSAADHSTFTDVPVASATDPLYPDSYVAVGVTNHVILGYTEDNTFRYYNNVTRQQILTMMVRAAGTALTEPDAAYKGKLDATDPTHVDVDDWDVTMNATRGEVAQMLANLLAKTGSIATGTSGHVQVSGLVAYPVGLTIARLQNMGLVTISATPPKATAPQDFTGVRFSALFAALKVSDTATTVKFVASDAFSVTMNIADIKAIPDDAAFLAIDYPAAGQISTVMPGLAGKNWIKDLVSMEFK